MIVRLECLPELVVCDSNSDDTTPLPTHASLATRIHRGTHPIPNIAAPRA
jgi:hypothetical protein